MNFDATVTLQTLIYAAMVFAGLITFVISAVGAKLFASKEALVELRGLIKETSFDARTAMQNEINRLEAHATERHELTHRDMARIEDICQDALAEAREAARTATEALHSSDKAQTSADRCEKMMDALGQRRRERDL